MRDIRRGRSPHRATRAASAAGRHLRRRRHPAGLQVDDLDVLPGGMEHLDHLRIGHQGVKGSEINAFGERIDDRLESGAGQLNEAPIPYEE